MDQDKIAERMRLAHKGHLAWAKAREGKLSRGCTAHDQNFGGGCFNCGYDLDRDGAVQRQERDNESVYCQS